MTTTVYLTPGPGEDQKRSDEEEWSLRKAYEQWAPGQHGPDDEYDPDCTCPTCLE